MHAASMCHAAVLLYLRLYMEPTEIFRFVVARFDSGATTLCDSWVSGIHKSMFHTTVGIQYVLTGRRHLLQSIASVKRLKR
jgi:hypothetical protein